jgi:Transposase DDE domain
LPVDLRVITGSANENNVFHPLVEDFLNESPYNWDVFLYDSGACSAENREFLKSEGMISGIVARKNIKREVILDVGHKRFCFSNDIPEGMSLEQYKRLLDHRSQEEAGFSGFTTYNNMKRMNSMGQEMATIHVTKYLILQLLTALSAYKVNRPDLIMMYKAFSSPA